MMTASIGQQLDAGSYLENLSHLIFPLNAEERVMCMLAAYFDESGTHAESPIICMAGYVSTVEQWVHFSRNWQERLDREGIDCFHMTDFESRRGVFKGMDKSTGNTLIESLIRIINLRVLYSFAIVFTKDDFAEIIGTNYTRTIGREWRFCAMASMTVLKKWADERNHEGAIAYCFEQGGYRAGGLREAFEKTVNTDKAFAERHRMGTLTLGDRRILKPLQAADILAYEAYKHRYNKLNRPELPMRKSLEKLLQAPSHNWLMTKDHLKVIAECVPDNSKYD